VSEYPLAINDAEIRRYALMAKHARTSEAELWAKAGKGPGATVGDIGCGPAAVSTGQAPARGDAAGGQHRHLDGG
jgi:hypothetical protein